jgi:charged multivesicular body protein 6
LIDLQAIEMGQRLSMCFETNDSSHNQNTQKKTSMTMKPMSDLATSAYIQEEDKVILKLKISKDAIFSKSKTYRNKAKTNEDQAKQFLKSGEKDRAMLCLKRKKLYAELADKCITKVDFLEKQVIEIENAVDDRSFLSVVKEANAFLSELNEKIDRSAFEDLADNLREGDSRKQEIDNILEEFGLDHDQEVNMEYDRIENEILNDSLKHDPKLASEIIQRKQQSQYGGEARLQPRFVDSHESSGSRGMEESGIGDRLAALA